MGNRVHSLPVSGRQGGRHSTIVRCRGLMSHSTRTWSRACSGTRCPHQRRTRAMSSSGSPGIWSVFQAAADVGGVAGPVPGRDVLPGDGDLDVDAEQAASHTTATAGEPAGQLPTSRFGTPQPGAEDGRAPGGRGRIHNSAALRAPEAAAMSIQRTRLRKRSRPLSQLPGPLAIATRTWTSLLASRTPAQSARQSRGTLTAGFTLSDGIGGVRRPGSGRYPRRYRPLV
jgi:hypothetical protein